MVHDSNLHSGQVIPIMAAQVAHKAVSRWHALQSSLLQHHDWFGGDV